MFWGIQVELPGVTLETFQYVQVLGTNSDSVKGESTGRGQVVTWRVTVGRWEPWSGLLGSGEDMQEGARR
jgi:hypothetical protein